MSNENPTTRWATRVLLIPAFCLLPSAYCLATTRQEDVFRSISDNVSQSDSSGHGLFGVLAAAVGLVMLLVLFSQRSKREAMPKKLNHQGKLLKEIVKSVPLRPAEIKQLRLLADASNATAGATPEPIENPLVMILCPSLLTRTVQGKPGKLDKKVLGGLAKKMGLLQTSAAGAARKR